MSRLVFEEGISCEFPVRQCKFNGLPTECFTGCYQVGHRRLLCIPEQLREPKTRSSFQAVSTTCSSTSQQQRLSICS